MAEKEDSEKGSCCSGGGKCCGCKCVKALVMLLIGGVIGYLLGGHCAYRKGACPMTGMMSTTTTTPQK
jgi:hypothetical protein